MNAPSKAERIKALRDEKQISLFEAKGIIERDDRFAALEAATTIEDIKQILKELI